MEKTIFFFDGHCKFCVASANHFKKAKGHEQIIFVDITNKPQFDYYRENLTFEEANKAMFSKLPNGEFRRGIDAVLTLWNLLPEYQFLALIFDNKIAKPLARWGYNFVAKNRKYFPVKSNIICDGTTCRKEF